MNQSRSEALDSRGVEGSRWDRRGISFQDLKEAVLVRRHWVTRTLMCSLALVTLWFFWRPSYKVSTTLLVSRAQNSSLQAMVGRMTGTQMAAGRLNDYQEKFLVYLNSHEFRTAAARVLIQDPRFEDFRERVLKESPLKRIIEGVLYVRMPEIAPAEKAVETLGRALKMGRFYKKGFDNIEIVLKYSRPEEAVQLVNFLADTAVAILAEREVNELNLAQRYVEHEIESVDQRVDHLDAQVVQFRKTNKYFATDAIPNHVVDKIRNLQAAVESSRMQIALNKTLSEKLRGELDKDKQLILSENAQQLKSSDVVSQLHAKLQNFRYRKILLEAQGEAANSNQMKALDDTIEQVAHQLRRVMKESGGTDSDVDSLLSDKDGLVVKIHSLKRENEYLESQLRLQEKSLQEAMQPLAQMPASAQHLVGLGRNMQMELKTLEEMRRRVLEMEIEKVSLKSKIRVIERATLASVPRPWGLLPRWILATLATLAGLLGVFYALEATQEYVRGRLDFRELNLPLMGSVPELGGSIWSRWGFLTGRDQSPVDFLKTWKSSEETPLKLSMAHLAARLWKAQGGGSQGKVFVMTSSHQGEGKSFVTAHLGAALAATGKKVLLVDSDFRRPALARNVGVSPSEKGFADVLKGGCSWKTVVRSNYLPSLDICSVGEDRSGASRLLTDGAIEKVFQEWRQSYDVILVDAAPTLPVVDALLLANLSDAVVLTVAHRRVLLRDLDATLEKARSMCLVPLLGVLNRVPNAQDYVYVSSAPRKAQKAVSFATEKDIQQALADFQKPGEATQDPPGGSSS